MTTLIEVIKQEMEMDDEDQSGRLFQIYQDADAIGKEIIDEVLMAVCGWTMLGLLEKT